MIAVVAVAGASVAAAAAAAADNTAVANRGRYDRQSWHNKVSPCRSLGGSESNRRALRSLVI